VMLLQPHDDPNSGHHGELRRPGGIVPGVHALCGQRDRDCIACGRVNYTPRDR
jgi:hypothetical protein